jgi:hypothetical protein
MSKQYSRIITFKSYPSYQTKLIRAHLLQHQKGRGSHTVLTKAVVQHLPEVVCPRMYIIRNSDRLQNVVSSSV